MHHGRCNFQFQIIFEVLEEVCFFQSTLEVLFQETVVNTKKTVLLVPGWDTNVPKAVSTGPNLEAKSAVHCTS